MQILEVVHFDVDVQTVTERMCRRAYTQDRSDDLNETAIVIRLRVYSEETKPIFENFKAEFLGFEIDNNGTQKQGWTKLLERLIANGFFHCSVSGEDATNGTHSI